MTAATFDATNEAYHRLPGLSNSRLTDFIDGGPELFDGYYVSQRWQRPEPTPDMEFGTEIHTLLESPDAIDKLMVEIPASALNGDGHRKGAAWKAFAFDNIGKIMCKPSEIEPYREIVANVKAHQRASYLLWNGEAKRELNIKWTDTATGLECRARLDAVTPGVAIADVKTTTSVDPRKFASTIYSFGYHRQAALYSLAWEELTGDVLDFVFVAIRKSRPYTVECFDLDETFLDLGSEEVGRAMRELQECQRTGIWLRDQSIKTLKEPAYAKYQHEWEAA